jgi:hypothetical protein
MVVVAVLLVVLLAAIAFILLEIRKAQRKLMDTAERLADRLSPTVSSVNDLSANLKEISEMAVRRATQVEETVVLANRRVRTAVDLAYRRVREFDALLEVVQSEAEGLFTSTVAGLTGFRRGARAIFGGRARRRRFRGLRRHDHRRRMRARLEEDDDAIWGDEQDSPDVGISAPLDTGDEDAFRSAPSIRPHRGEDLERERD